MQTGDSERQNVSLIRQHYEDDTVVYEVEVPFDAQAEFSVEGMEPKTLQAGSYVFQVKAEI